MCLYFVVNYVGLPVRVGLFVEKKKNYFLFGG